MPNYPIINFLVRHGHRFAIGVALLPVRWTSLSMPGGAGHTRGGAIAGASST